MPKTPVDKNCHALSREYDVRTTGQILSVDSVTEAPCMKRLPELELGAGVFRPDQSHPLATLIRGKGINHRSAALFAYHSKGGCPESPIDDLDVPGSHILQSSLE